eukprot:5966175-Ditylum_brightwellii.AAC.1
MLQSSSSAIGVFPGTGNLANILLTLRNLVAVFLMLNLLSFLIWLQRQIAKVGLHIPSGAVFKPL